MNALIDKWAKAIAEQAVFRASTTVWEMTWVEVTPHTVHETLIKQHATLTALWHVSEYLFQDVYISKEHLTYILQQGRAASEKTLRATVKKIVDTKQEEVRFGWLVERLARDIMEKLNYTETERKSLKIHPKAKYIAPRNDRAKLNFAAVRKTAISVHQIVTAEPFTQWLISTLSKCKEVGDFDKHASSVLNNYEQGEFRQRMADEIRRHLTKHGYIPSPEENMPELKVKGTPPCNPSKEYLPNKRNFSIFDLDSKTRDAAFEPAGTGVDSMETASTRSKKRT